FAFSKGMAKMLPEFIPYKTDTVYLTRIIEIAAAIGIFIPQFRVIILWLVIGFFIFIFSANICSSVKYDNYQNGSFDGNGLTYLWFRIPLQVLFIIWTYLSSIRS